MSLASKLTLTEAEYLNGEFTSKDKHQFVSGEVYAMAGASVDHNRIAGNIFSEFRIAFKGQFCEPFIADMKVSALGDYYYPDVMVVCDDHKDDSDYVKHAPKLIVEVLSRSTRVFDHSIKQAKYLKIPSLEYYVLIEQDLCEVSVLSRSAGFIPQYYYLGDVIEFPILDVVISVNDIYERIENEDKTLYLQSLLVGDNK